VTVNKVIIFSGTGFIGLHFSKYLLDSAGFRAARYPATAGGGGRAAG
jgi:nucleoside-diphosphate-sugar epimerase